MSDAAKAAAAAAAVAEIGSGMQVGLGTGSTAEFFIRKLAERAKAEGLELLCAATSARSAELGASLGLDIRPLDELESLDVTVDGADEFDPALGMIKGGGGALLREKIVAAASARYLIIADASKKVERLGAFPLPVEVIPFGASTTSTAIANLLALSGHEEGSIDLRMKGDRPFVTDEGNVIFDLRLGAIEDAEALAMGLLQIPGVVETGLFLDMADVVFMGRPDGSVERIVADANGRSLGDLHDLAALDGAGPKSIG